MNSMHIVNLLLMAMMLGSVAVGQALGQTDDWQALKAIPARTRIQVILKHRQTFGNCSLEEVTDDALGCYFNSVAYRQYNRDEIRAVYLRHNTVKAGLLVGTGVGAILGASNGNGGGAGRLLGVIILAPVVGCIGAGIGAIVAPAARGRIIYRSPDFRPRKSKAKPLPPAPETVPNNEDFSQR